MPFKSQAQRAWMHIHHPKMARKWDAHTPKGKKLPQHVGETADENTYGDNQADSTMNSELDGPLPSLWDIFGRQPGRTGGAGT